MSSANSNVPFSDMRPISRLRSLVHALQRGELPPPHVAAWFIASEQRYEAAAMAGAPISFDVAGGLGAPNRHGWWKTEAMAQRDALIRELRDRCYPHLEDSKAAAAISDVLADASKNTGDPLVLAIICVGQKFKLGPKRIAMILRKHEAA